MTTDDVLLGLALVLCLAVGSQLVAARMRLPAIIVLLPVGFVAGDLTTKVHPDVLLGQLYQPFVSVAVGVVLFEAGLGLSLVEMAESTRRVVWRLVAAGVVVTCLGAAVTVIGVFDGLTRGVALVIGAILVVSGPTVVLPLLAHIKPVGSIRAVLKWEGVLVDPVGALLGVFVFHAVSAGFEGHRAWHPGTMLMSVGAGALVGVLAAGVLMVLLEAVQREAPRQTVVATLMVVVAAVVAADLLRDDAGFIAATILGIVLGNQRRVDVALTREFQETLVQLLVGVLFVLIAASVSPADVRNVLAGSLVLIAVLVLVLRPLTVVLATMRSSFSWRERALLAWMAPRGIVAGATASAFGLQLQALGVQGSEKVLPIVFVVIFATVLLYGLTSPLAARALGLTGGGATTVLVVGGHGWAREMAAALRAAGIEVRMWAGSPDDRAQASAAGIPAARGRLMVDAVSREAELEEITDALLLGSSDDFNAVAAATLRTELGHAHVFRVAPRPEGADLLPPAGETRILGGAALTFAELDRRFGAGSRIEVRAAGDAAAPPGVPLFAVSSGRLAVAADGRPPALDADATVVCLVDGV